MRYEKKIRYLEYWENGVKIRNVGFVSAQVKKERCTLQLQISHLPVKEEFVREVRIEEGKKGTQRESILGKIRFHAGCGVLEQKELPIEDLAGGIGYDELCAIRISLGSVSEILCMWREEQQDPELDCKQEQITELQSEIAQQPFVLQPAKELQLTTISQPITEQQEPSAFTPPQPASNRHSSGFLDTKWRQLEQIYPKTAPFQDERIYLSIGPQDFVIFPDAYYGLIKNSFLLHGYYNYGHMILTKVKSDGRERFFLGVPGNFYEQERQAAILYGFESFECKKEPVQKGDYGYYMIPVEI